MHIHHATTTPAALVPTQSAQQATAARKAAAEVRAKLSSFAAGDDDAISRIDGYAAGGRNRRQYPQKDDEQFRQVLVSVTA
jgi:hypothetical protein